jgi:hypothetical protein
MKTLYNLNNDMHANDGLSIPLKLSIPFIPFIPFVLYLFIHFMLMLYALQFKLYSPILYKSCFLQVQIP